MSQRHPFFDVSESCKNTGIQENPTANLPQDETKQRNDTTAEQIAKEAKERQSKAGGDRKSDEYKKSVSSNLDEAIKDSGRTDEIMAKKAGIFTLYKHRSHVKRTQTTLPYK